MKVTLKGVQKKAMADAAFFRQLRANPDRALQANRMELSRADYKRLKGVLDLDGTTVKLDLGELMTRARRAQRPGEGLFWTGLWNVPVRKEDLVLPPSKLPL